MRNDVITVITVNRVISLLKPLNIPKQLHTHATPRRAKAHSGVRRELRGTLLSVERVAKSRAAGRY